VLPQPHRSRHLLPQYTTLDRTEASFPSRPVRQADSRRLASRTRPNAFFNTAAATADAADVAGAYGRCELPTKPKPGRDLLWRHEAANCAAQFAGGGAGDMAADAGQPFASVKGSVFITQRGSVSTGGGGHQVTHAPAQSASGGAGGGSTRRFSAEGMGPTGAHMQPDHTVAALSCAASASVPQTSTSGGGCRIEAAVATPGDSALDQQPEPQPLTEPTRIEPGSSNPVPIWHNRYRVVRQAGRTALQQDLWHRSQRRAAYRSSPKLAAELTQRLVADLEAAEGRLTPGWVPGGQRLRLAGRANLPVMCLMLYVAERGQVSR
jgi:hypothetical protein